MRLSIHQIERDTARHPACLSVCAVAGRVNKLCHGKTSFVFAIALSFGKRPHSLTQLITHQNINYYRNIACEYWQFSSFSKNLEKSAKTRC